MKEKKEWKTDDVAKKEKKEKRGRAAAKVPGTREGGSDAKPSVQKNENNIEWDFSEH